MFLTVHNWDIDGLKGWWRGLKGQFRVAGHDRNAHEDGEKSYHEKRHAYPRFSSERSTKLLSGFGAQDSLGAGSSILEDILSFPPYLICSLFLFAAKLTIPGQGQRQER